MGDRATLAVIATYPTRSGTETTATYGYTHWAGETLPERVRRALQRSRPRYAEPLYMTRILWGAVECDDWGSIDGYGLGPRMLDTEPGRPVLVVNLDDQTIGVAPLDRRAVLPTVERSIRWVDYVARPPRTWGKGLLA